MRPFQPILPRLQSLLQTMFSGVGFRSASGGKGPADDRFPKAESGVLPAPSGEVLIAAAAEEPANAAPSPRRAEDAPLSNPAGGFRRRYDAVAGESAHAPVGEDAFVRGVGFEAHSSAPVSVGSTRSEQSPILAPADGGLVRVEDHSRNIYHAGTKRTLPENVVVEDHSRNIFFGARNTADRLTDRGRTPQRVRLALE